MGIKERVGNVSGEKGEKKLILLYKPPSQAQQAILEHYLFFLTLSRNEKESNFGEHSCCLNLDVMWILRLRLTVLWNLRRFEWLCCLGFLNSLWRLMLFRFKYQRVFPYWKIFLGVKVTDMKVLLHLSCCTSGLPGPWFKSRAHWGLTALQSDCRSLPSSWSLAKCCAMRFRCASSFWHIPGLSSCFSNSFVSKQFPNLGQLSQGNFQKLHVHWNKCCVKCSQKVSVAHGWVCLVGRWNLTFQTIFVVLLW